MPIPSLEHETPEASPIHSAASTAQYEVKCVQALRGRESNVTAKWHAQGWELVSMNRGTLRTELHFRRVKRKTLAAHLEGAVATIRRKRPRVQPALLVSCALLLVMGGLALVAGSQTGSDTTEPGVAPSTASVAPTADQTIADVTVDELVARINAGETSVGDLFRITGELVRPDLWTTGASGRFSVLLATAQGSDLEVFVDQSAASGWQDGTTVEMVVRNVEVTINDETMDGFFEAQSAKTIAG